MNQREVINEIKRTKWELQQKFDPELLVKLYKLIDKLGMPKEEIPNRKTAEQDVEQALADGWLGAKPWSGDTQDCDLEGVV